MAITPILNNRITKAALNKTGTSSYINSAKEEKSKVDSYIRGGKEWADAASDLIAGITPDIKESAGDLLGSLAGKQDILSAGKDNKIATKVLINNLANLGPDSAGAIGANQIVQLFTTKQQIVKDAGKNRSSSTRGKLVYHDVQYNANINDILTHATFLPLPSTISFSTGFVWNVYESGALGDAIDKYNGKTSIDTLGGMKDMASVAGGVVGNLAKVGQHKIAKNLSETISGGEGLYKALEAKSGKVFNPRENVYFDGIKHRTFQVVWDLAPQDEQASVQVMALIKALHIQAAPATTKNKSFWTMPDIFTFSIIDTHTPKTILDRGEVAITGIECDYTPDGVWAAFRSGQPVHITLTVDFMEMQLPDRARNIEMLSSIDNIAYKDQ